MKSYCAYIMASHRRVLYIGFTGRLQARVKEHKTDFYPESFTSRYRCHNLVYWERRPYEAVGPGAGQSVMRPALVFRLLLLLYPTSFRREYGDEMWRVFAERRADTRGLLARAWLWLAALGDALATAPRLHVDILRQDLRYALRGMRRAPGFTATVLVVAALGIGANAATFSLTDYVLLRPLPYADSSRLVAVWQHQLTGSGHYELSPFNYREWKRAGSFEAMGAATSLSANLVGQGQPMRVDCGSLDADVLPLLGVQPMLGRGFSPEDTRTNAAGTVILSWRLWQRAFAGDPAVLGRSITLDGEPFAVIGVMPPSFAYPSRETELWQALRFRADSFDDPSDTYLHVVGKLKPGATVEEARAELDTLAVTLERAHPKENEGVRPFVRPLHDELSEKSRVLVLALSGAALCVLLITCLNLANLLLARALMRRRELALRAALGAGRERLVRQLVTESLILAIGGGLLGVGLAEWSLPLLAHLVPAELPLQAAPTIDLRVLGAAALATGMAALLFGVVPSLRACSGVDSDGLREGARAGVGGRRGRLVRALVVAEVAVSLALLVSSGLLLRALYQLNQRDPGFRPDGVLTLRTWLPWPKYANNADRARFYDRVLDEARALPGVDGAAYISFLPMAMGGGIWNVEIPGHADDTVARRAVSLRFVTPGFFSVMQVPLRAGRDVGPGDTIDREMVAVVSESFARQHWPGQDPLGKRFKVAFNERTIVGVVGDIRVRGLEHDSEPQVYLPYRQQPDGSLIFYPPKDLVVRSSLPTEALAGSLRAIVARADPQQPVSNIQPFGEIVAAQTASRRVQLYVIGAFAALAVLLAAIGIYGLLAFAVSNRLQEIGVRMALGASPASVLSMVLREGLVLAAIGAAAGVGAAWAAGRSLQAVLVGVAPLDALSFAGALVVVSVMTLAGSMVPAWRASRVDPAVALRAD